MYSVPCFLGGWRKASAAWSLRLQMAIFLAPGCFRKPFHFAGLKVGRLVSVNTQFWPLTTKIF